MLAKKRLARAKVASASKCIGRYRTGLRRPGATSRRYGRRLSAYAAMPAAPATPVRAVPALRIRGMRI